MAASIDGASTRLPPVVIGGKLDLSQSRKNLAPPGRIARLVSHLLYAVGPLDPWAFTLAPLTLIAAALLACWLPARRATRVSPLTALRTE